MKNKLVGLNKNDIRKIVESKVPNDVEFYYDPRYEYGCYAKKKIDAQALNPIYGYNFKTDEYFIPKIKEPQQ